ncbi:MAG TPA: hypothetical protein VGE07_03320, partial [Herpetosiphonaceae bacterium]
MQTTPLPEIDARTLALIARRAAKDEFFLLTDSRVQPMKQVASALATGGLYRVAGSGWSGQRRSSWSAVLKIVRPPPADDTPAPAPEIGAAEQRDQWNYWQRESLVYASDLLDELAPGLAAPRCFRIMSPNQQSRWLWLEDIGGTPAPAWPLERYGLAARHFGRWQGSYLAGRTLPELPWLSKGWQRARLGLETPDFAALRGAWKHPLVKRWFPRALAKALPRIWAGRGALLDALDRLPRTLCHFDVWPPNLIARRTARGGDETVALDWSYLGYGAAGLDAGNLTLGATARWHVLPADLPKLEALVYPGYLAGLADAGWQGDERAVRLAYALAGGLLASSEGARWIGQARDEESPAGNPP